MPIDPPQKEVSSTSSIARDVIANRGQYGRFAAQWFSKQGWSGGKGVGTDPASKQVEQPEAIGSAAHEHTAVAKNQPDTSKEPKSQGQEHVKDARRLATDISITEAIPKILRRTKMILTSGSYFFSYEFDLTRRMALIDGRVEAPTRETLDSMVRDALCILVTYGLLVLVLLEPADAGALP